MRPPFTSEIVALLSITETEHQLLGSLETRKFRHRVELSSASPGDSAKDSWYITELSVKDVNQKAVNTNCQYW